MHNIPLHLVYSHGTLYTLQQNHTKKQSTSNRRRDSARIEVTSITCFIAKESIFS